MKAEELNKLMEAYKSVYAPKEEVVESEQLDEGMGLVTGTAKAVNAVLKPKGQTPEEGKEAVRRLTNTMDVVAKPVKSAVKAVLSVGDEKNAEMMNKRRPTAAQSAKMEEVDIFDIVKGYLIGEGATEEEVYDMMVHLTDEQRDAIVEALTPLGIKTAGVVDDQRRGSNMAQDMKSIQSTLRKLKPKGPVVTPGGLPGV